MQGTKDQGT